MKNVLVLAYAVSPIRGSEFSVGWNYIKSMSQEHRLTVVYGASGDHLGDDTDLHNFLKENTIKNVKFLFVKANSLMNIANYLNKFGIFEYSFYFAYNLWHRKVYSVVSKIVENEKFDIIHFLNLTGYREPGYLWKIDIPYIWGPMGGIPNRPKQLFSSLSVKNRFLFTIRNWVNTIQFNYNPRLQKALNATDLLLTGNSETKKLIEKKYKISSIYLPENGIANYNELVKKRTIQLTRGDLCNIFWIGRIDANKSLTFLIEALSNIEGRNWHLHVLGDGPLKSVMQQLAMEKHIANKISWHGHIPRSEVFSLLQSLHLHVITSLGELTTTVLFEAMSNGIPTITLNHCGMKDVICEKCGIKIDIDSVQQVIDDLSFAISDLVEHPEKINQLSIGVNDCAMSFTWERRRQLFNGYYDLAIQNWQQKKSAN